jgi:hypothetical protein
MWKVALAMLVACGFRPATAPEEAGMGSEPPIQIDADGSGSGSGSGSDSGTGHCDQLACSLSGGSCNADDECEIHVTDSSTSPACPAAMKCHISCDAQNTCDGLISCGNATACVIDCNMQNTCMNSTTTCGNGCTVYCRAQNTCRNAGWTCGTGAAACELECCSTNTCANNPASGTLDIHDPGTCP